MGAVIRRGSTMADMNEFNATVIEEFRQNAGKVGGSFEGADMVLITTTGAKAGRMIPVVALVAT